MSAFEDIDATLGDRSVRALRRELLAIVGASLDPA